MISGATTSVLLSHYDTTTTTTTTGLAVGTAAMVATTVLAVVTSHDTEQDMIDMQKSVYEAPDARAGFASCHFGSCKPRAIHLCSPD